MNTWRRPQRRATILRTMLFAWLFGLAAGWANACVLQARNDVHHGPLGHDVGAAVHPHPAALVVRTIVGAGEPAAEVCLSLCDGERSVIPKLKVAATADPGVEPAVLVALWLHSSVDLGSARALGVAKPPPPGPPVAIRFQRLTR